MYPRKATSQSRSQAITNSRPSGGIQSTSMPAYVCSKSSTESARCPVFCLFHALGASAEASAGGAAGGGGGGGSATRAPELDAEPPGAEPGMYCSNTARYADSIPDIAPAEMISERNSMKLYESIGSRVVLRESGSHIWYLSFSAENSTPGQSTCFVPNYSQ